MEITALVLQSWFDIAIRYSGSVFNAYDIATENGYSVSDAIAPGQVVVISSNIVLSTKEISFFDRENSIPATAITTAQLEATNPQLGIGAMIIKENFIVG